jgi:hypothetical protein
VSERELEDVGAVPLLELAARYARSGLRIFPVDMRQGPDGKHRKTPLHGYEWKQRASSRVNEVVEDVSDAIGRIGEEHVGIGWALGLDRNLALDLDVSKAPVWWADLLDPAGVAQNITSRGVHLVYRMPDGRTIGNGTANFPSRGWGEVRGAGGYIVIAGPDRPGFNPAELANVRTFPRPDWLSDAGPDVKALGSEELEAWLDGHRGPTRPGRLEGFTTRLEAWTIGESRHDTARDVACWMMREACAGVVDAVAAVEVLVGWWGAHAELPGLRRLGDRELVSILRWAVAVAEADTERVAEIRAEADAFDGFEEVSLDELLGSASSSEVSTFDPLDLGPVLAGHVLSPMASLLTLDDGRALLHVRRLNEIHGDSGSGKSWIVAAAIAELLEAGAVVALLDVESDPGTLIERLRQIGTDDDAIRHGLAYIRPDEAFTRPNVERLVAHVGRLDVAHVFLDSLGEAFALEGIDENLDAEVAPWYTRAVRPILATGAGVTIVDHITKAGELPLHPSGSKRKRAVVDGTSWLIAALEPFTKTDGGRLSIRCGKDRHGAYRRGDVIAELVMSGLDVTTGRSMLTLTAPADLGAGATSRTSDVELVCNVLGAVGVPLSLDAIRSKLLAVGIKLGKDRVRGACEDGVLRGFLVEHAGPRGARHFGALDEVPISDE